MTKTSNSGIADNSSAEKRANFVASKPTLRILVFALGVVLTLLSPFAMSTGYCFGPTDGLDLQPNSNGGDDKISYEALVQLLNHYLENAQQVNIFVDACHSGGFISQAEHLNMPYFLTTSQTKPEACAVAGSSTTDVVPPGRLTISKVGKTDRYYFGFAEYWTKELKNAVEVPTPESLFITSTDDVKKDKSMKSEKPTSTSGNNADPLKNINGGSRSNHALIFDGDRGGLALEPGLELYRALADPKYGFKNNGNSLAFYKTDSRAQDFEGTHIDGPGTLENLRKALDDLKTLVDAHQGEELVNIFINGHGYEEAALAPQQPGLDGIPKDGFLVQGGTAVQFDLPTDSEFWSELKIGLSRDDRKVVRVHLPSFLLDLSEASLRAPIAIAIDGMPLGYFTVPSTSTGAELKVSLPDWYTRALIATAGGAPSIPVTFVLASGDWMRFATDDDIFLNSAYQKGNAGFGIAVSIADVDYADHD